jgi:hypothetical protein
MMDSSAIRDFTRLGSLAAAVACLLFNSCEYEVPITEKPTRKIDEKLLGDWEAKDDSDGKTVKMKVVKLDDANYIVSFDEHLYRVYHSDVGKTPFVSVQDLGSDSKPYSYSVWKLTEDGALVGRSVSDKVVPDATKDSATVQKLLKQNLDNPELFEKNEMRFTKVK